MHVVRSAPDFVDIHGRDAARAPLLLGLVLVVGVTLALVGAPDLTHAHIGPWLLVASFGCWLVYFGRPRSRRILLRRGVVDVDGTTVNVSDGLFVLVPTHRGEAAGPSDYAVALAPSSGARIRLLSASSPDRVLGDLAVVRRVLPLPVSPGWGLPPDAPWLAPLEGSATTPIHAASTRRSRSQAAERASGRTKKSIVGTMLVGSLGVSAIIVNDVWTRVALGESPSALSLVLPILGVSIVVAIALGIGSSRTTLELAPDVSFTRFLYGVPIQRRSLARRSIRAAYLVGPNGAAPRHVLFATADGPLAFPCAPDVGERFLDDLYGGGPEISKAPPRQSRT